MYLLSMTDTRWLNRVNPNERYHLHMRLAVGGICCQFCYCGLASAALSKYLTSVDLGMAALLAMIWLSLLIEAANLPVSHAVGLFISTTV